MSPLPLPEPSPTPLVPRGHASVQLRPAVKEPRQLEEGLAAGLGRRSQPLKLFRSWHRASCGGPGPARHSHSRPLPQHALSCSCPLCTSLHVTAHPWGRPPLRLGAPAHVRRRGTPVKQERPPCQPPDGHGCRLPSWATTRSGCQAGPHQLPGDAGRCKVCRSGLPCVRALPSRSRRWLPPLGSPARGRACCGHWRNTLGSKRRSSTGSTGSSSSSGVGGQQRLSVRKITTMMRRRGAGKAAGRQAACRVAQVTLSLSPVDHHVALTQLSPAHTAFRCPHN